MKVEEVTLNIPQVALQLPPAQMVSRKVVEGVYYFKALFTVSASVSVYCILATQIYTFTNSLGITL